VSPVRRRQFLIAAGALLAAPRAAQAQPAGKLPKLGVLVPSSQDAAANFVEAFRQGLLERGYVEPKTITLEVRAAGGDPQRLAAFAGELARLDVDVIVTVGTGIVAAKRATASIPIVMRSTVDPVKAGFVASLAKPGRNITGVTSVSSELQGKRLELLREAFPSVSRVAVIWNGAEPGASAEFAELTAAARRLGLDLISREVRTPSEFDAALQAAARDAAGALVTIRNPLLVTHQATVVALAARYRLPAIYDARDAIVAGGLMSYGADLNDLHRRLAGFVDRILRGAKPSDLPVEQPTKFHLVINLKTAKALGLTIPKSVLLRADEVIQ
jgi:putative ABC transport system substrate-binding protein